MASVLRRVHLRILVRPALVAGLALGALAFQAGTALAAPTNDSFAAAQALTGATGTTTGTNVGATLETGEPLHAGVTDGASVWYSWTAPASGATTIDTFGSSFDTILAVYTGSAVNGLTAIAGNDDFNGGHTSQVGFTAVAGTTYRIAVAGYRNPTTGTIAAGTITLDWNGPGPPPAGGPANDNFAAAQALTGATGTVVGTNVSATLETGEPLHAGVTDGASIWYSWTSPGAGAATIDTAGSGFDTILAVYTGSAVGALTSIAGNDDCCGGRTSQVSFTAAAGTTYRIAVAGYRSPTTGAISTGPLTLNWNGPSGETVPGAPPNDNLAAAQTLSGSTGTVAGTNVGATLESGEPLHAGVTDGASVWYSWTSPGAGAATIDTFGSGFDTLLGVYTGTSIGTLGLIAANDDSNGGRTSQVSFTAVAGKTYRIAVAGYRNPTTGTISTGAVKVDWNGPPAPGPDLQPPTVRLSQPAAGAHVAGIVSLASTATDDTGVARVDFLVNGAVARTVALAPYNALWDSTTVPNGTVTIAARAVDISGKTTTTPAVTVTVQNAPPSHDPVLLAAGDIGRCGAAGPAQTAALLGIPGATIASLGDHAYDTGTADQFTNCYDPTWGAVKARTRPTAGNHDYDSVNANGYYGYFGSAAGDPAKGYYSYNLGSWHIVVLNSNCAFVACTTGSAQEQWLKSDLAASKQNCTLAYFHHPLFTSDANTGTQTPAVQPLWQDLYNDHTELILNGHSHDYERFAPQRPDSTPDPHGITEFVVGTGGAELDTFGTVQRNSVTRASVNGVLQLTLHAKSWDWSFLAVPGSSFTDSGTSNCH